MAAAGRKQSGSMLEESTPSHVYLRASQNKDREFMEYLLSIIYVESRFDKLAVSPMSARGLMQMTEIAVREAVGSCSGLTPIGDMGRLHDSYTNVKYGSCFLEKLLTDMDGDWTRTLIAYNGGYAQLIKYDRGDTITHETSNYVLKVNRALNKICRQPQLNTVVSNSASEISSEHSTNKNSDSSVPNSITKESK